jgi:hypothetical protein
MLLCITNTVPVFLQIIKKNKKKLHQRNKRLIYNTLQKLSNLTLKFLKVCGCRVPKFRE